MRSTAMVNAEHKILLKVFRFLLIVVGLFFMIFAVLADILGYGDTGSFGIGQYLLFLLGLIILLIGLFGIKFIVIYRNSAVILLNTIILLVLLELGAIVLGRISFRFAQAEIRELPYYANQDWSEVYWEEAKNALGVAYEPYIVWRHTPVKGETINFNEDGIRRTPGANCQPNARKIFAFGGSTMLGWGSPDWATIPAYLQISLEEYLREPVCIVNYGEDGYVSTQSLVALVLLLQSGNIPDSVIFYDGVNEVIAAYESGQPGAHVTLAKIASKFEEQESPLVKLGKATRIYKLLRNWLDAMEEKKYGDIPDISVHQGVKYETRELANEMTEVYLGNYKIVKALAKEYNFEFFFFLQPHPAIGGKALTNEEKAITSRMDTTLTKIANAYYGNIASLDRDYQQLWYLGNIFDDQEMQIWIDEVGHITPEGNHLVAKAMLDVVKPRLVGK